MALSLVGPALLYAYVGVTSYRATLDEARARLRRVSQIVEEQALRIVETNEIIARSIDGALRGLDTVQVAQRQPELHRLMKSLSGDLAQLQSIWLWDRDGRPVASSLMPVPPPTLRVDDREYFRWARTSRDTGWYVSEPLRSRVTGQPFFDFTRRRIDAHGEWVGVLSVSLRPDYFDRFFRDQVLEDPTFAITLVRADGVVIARYPAVPLGSRLGASSPLLAAMTAGRPQGETSGLSSLDGRWRHVAFRRIGTLPLYAVATADQEKLLAPWRRSMTTLALFTFPLATGLALLCGFAIAQVRRERAISESHALQVRQRRRAEDALRQSQKLEALGRLTGGVAHDFNNLLMVVQTSAALAGKLSGAGRAIDAPLSTIRRAVDNGAQLTRQLLAFARRQPLEVRRLDPHDAIGSLSQLIGSTVGSGIEVGMKIADDLPDVDVDQAELELAVLNLCINARDAMDGRGRLTVSVESATEPGGDRPGLRLQVADTGRGIAAELLDRVVEPFFTTKPMGQGTGLGLSQVHGFTVQSGGRVAIDSVVGQGTTVTLWLPASRSSGGAVRRTEERPLRWEGRLLLVEDNAEIAASLGPLLEAMGATVERAPDADQAIALLLEREATEFDVVLSDIRMPGTHDGIAFARWLAVERPGLPVVLMTGYSDRLASALDEGWQVLPKPLTPERLVDALASASPPAARSTEARG